MWPSSRKSQGTRARQGQPRTLAEMFGLFWTLYNRTGLDWVYIYIIRPKQWKLLRRYTSQKKTRNWARESLAAAGFTHRTWWPSFKDGWCSSRPEGWSGSWSSDSTKKEKARQGDIDRLQSTLHGWDHFPVSIPFAEAILIRLQCQQPRQQKTSKK